MDVVSVYMTIYSCDVGPTAADDLYK